MVCTGPAELKNIGISSQGTSPIKKRRKRKQDVSVFLFLLQKDKNGYFNLLVQRRRYTSKKDFNNHGTNNKKDWEVQGGRCKNQTEIHDKVKTIYREFTEETGMSLQHLGLKDDDFELFLIEEYMNKDTVKHTVFNYYTIINSNYDMSSIKYRTNEAESIGFIELGSLKFLSKNFYDPNFYQNFIVKLQDTLNGINNMHINIYPSP